MTNFQSEISTDGTIKLIFEKGHHCVIIPQKKAYTLCVSSQVGCAVGCKFCYTAKMGFLSNLSAQEIVEQYEISKEFLKTYKNNNENKPQLPIINSFVFMGMGEPLLNSKEVYKACDILNSKHNFSYKRITISTSGILPKMIEFVDEKRPMKLALSLHSPNSQIREKIMPIAKKYPFSKLIEFCNNYNQTYKDPIMIEYLMIKGLTDSNDDLNLLLNANLSKGTYINLIPLNGEMIIDDETYLGTDMNTILNWKKEIMNNQYKCFIRCTMGEDINAACGMLNSNEE